MNNPIFQPAILYVDDEQHNLDSFRRAFAEDYPVKTCISAQEGLKVLEKEDFSMVIADQRMPGMTGIELCEKIYQTKPETIRIILTAYTETQFLLDAIHRGHVHDYIVKPWKKSELKPVLDKAFEDYKQKKIKLEELKSKAIQVERLQKEITEIYDPEGVVGAETGLRPIMETLKKAAPTDATILLLGETGTGKEVLARKIHRLSQRSSGPFVPVHCAALVQTLLESELFGHEKGAFTGADRTHVGSFEMAHGGSLFLDELGEIPEEIQVKLLRVLQEKKVQRVGSTKLIPVDVRLVAATNRNLEKAVQEGKFRADLFFRLNVISVSLPPLRERKEDIPALAEYVLNKLAQRSGNTVTLSNAAIEYLQRYDWPGNVRELENIMERAVILSPGPQIEPEDLNLNFEESLRVENVDLGKISAPGTFRVQLQMKEVEELKEALVKTRGNISEAARLVNLPRTTFYNRLRKNGLV